MEFDPNNEVVRLCARGMEQEGQGNPEEAGKFFIEAWNKALSDRDKFTAAHYVARQQKNVADKLSWDETALQFALKIVDEKIKEVFPSLYLNIGKCYEDMNETEKAKKNYELALSFCEFLPDNGYAQMIKGGIENGIKRTNKK